MGPAAGVSERLPVLGMLIRSRELQSVAGPINRLRRAERNLPQSNIAARAAPGYALSSSTRAGGVESVAVNANSNITASPGASLPPNAE